MESWSLRGALQAAERRGRSLQHYLWRSSSTELVVVLAEDIAALLGLVFALAAALLRLVTGNPAWGGMAIGLQHLFVEPDED